MSVIKGEGIAKLRNGRTVTVRRLGVDAPHYAYEYRWVATIETYNGAIISGLYKDDGKFWPNCGGHELDIVEQISLFDQKGSTVATHDPVNHPAHYTKHPSGVECIQITEHMNFCLGNAMKYIWRAGDKDDKLEDLKKARWYLDREIERLEKAKQ